METGKERNEGLESKGSGQGGRKGKSCKGTLYYSSILKSKGRNPRCFGLPGTLPQVPSYLVGESEVEASKEGRSLTDFRYACVGYSVYLESNDTLTDDQKARPELPLCSGIELLVDKKPVAEHASARDPALVHAHSKEDDQRSPQPRPYKPTQPFGAGDEFLAKFTRNASLVAGGVARNVRKVGNHIKDSIDDILYPYRRPPK